MAGILYSNPRGSSSSRPNLDREIQLPQFELIKRRKAVVAGRRAQLLFDPQQLVVFCDAVGARSRAGFDLPRVGRDGQVDDEWVFGLARTVGDDSGVVIGLRQFDRVERL